MFLAHLSMFMKLLQEKKRVFTNLIHKLKNNFQQWCLKMKNRQRKSTSQGASAKIGGQFISKSSHIGSVPLEQQNTVTANWYREICLLVVIKRLTTDWLKATKHRNKMHSSSRKQCLNSFCCKNKGLFKIWGSSNCLAIHLTALILFHVTFICFKSEEKFLWNKIFMFECCAGALFNPPIKCIHKCMKTSI